MNLVDQKQIRTYVKRPDFAILVSKNLSGHRIEWLQVLVQNLASSDKKILILCEDYSRLESIDEIMHKQIFIYLVPQGIRFVNKILNGSGNQNILFWDADDKLFILLKAHYRARCLILRPYVTELRISIFFNYLIKIFLIGVLLAFRRHEIRLLAITGSKPILFRHFWVDDHLNVENFETKTIDSGQHLKHLKLLVPGYISKRKNPFDAILACKELREIHGIEIDLLFLGSIDSEIKKELDSFGYSWISVKNVYLSRNEYLMSLAEADLVLLPYSNRGSSGIVLETLAVGGTVAIYRNRHWQKLSLITNGQLILMKGNVRGIVSTIRDLARLSRQGSRPYKFGKARISVLDFLGSVIA